MALKVRCIFGCQLVKLEQMLLFRFAVLDLDLAAAWTIAKQNRVVLPVSDVDESIRFGWISHERPEFLQLH